MGLKKYKFLPRTKCSECNGTGVTGEFTESARFNSNTMEISYECNEDRCASCVEYSIMAYQDYCESYDDDLANGLTGG